MLYETHAFFTKDFSLSYEDYSIGVAFKRSILSCANHVLEVWNRELNDEIFLEISSSGYIKPSLYLTPDPLVSIITEVSIITINTILHAMALDNYLSSECVSTIAYTCYKIYVVSCMTIPLLQAIALLSISSSFFFDRDEQSQIAFCVDLFDQILTMRENIISSAHYSILYQVSLLSLMITNIIFDVSNYLQNRNKETSREAIIHSFDPDAFILLERQLEVKDIKKITDDAEEREALKAVFSADTLSEETSTVVNLSSLIVRGLFSISFYRNGINRAPNLGRALFLTLFKVNFLYVQDISNWRFNHTNLDTLLRASVRTLQPQEKDEKMKYYYYLLVKYNLLFPKELKL